MFSSENMNNVYETFGEEETIVLTDLLREYLGKYEVLHMEESGYVWGCSSTDFPFTDYINSVDKFTHYF